MANRIILDKPEHWDRGINFIKASVKDPYIWSLVDPEVAIKPSTTPDPTKPLRPRFDASGQVDAGEMEQYKALRLFRDVDLVKFKDEVRALRAITTLVFETTSARMINQVAYADPDPWSKLVALKQRLRPTDQLRSLLVEKRYHQLAKGPANQDIDTWLDEWSDMYHEAKRMNLSEVSGERAIRDFFLVIETVDSVYADCRQELRNAVDEQNQELTRQIRQRTMDEEIEKFRNRLRLQSSTSTLKDTHLAFVSDIQRPTFQGNDQEGNKVEGKRKVKTPICICGARMWYSDCPYLVPIKAPVGWRENSDIRTKVNDALQDPKVRARVNKSLERAGITTENSDAASAHTRSDILTSVYTGLAAHVPEIGSYLIHGGGSNTHVCNGKSAHLYTKTKDARDDEYLNTGGGKMKIESWGRMETAF